MDPVQVAPLADAALTPYHAIKPALEVLHPASTAVVIGIGGLGHMAVQLLRALSPTRIIAVDKDEARLSSARELGASDAILSGPDAASEIIERTEGHGAELVLDVVGSDETLALAAKVLSPEGRLSLIGLASGTLPFSFFGVPYGSQVSTSYWGTVTDLMDVVALARAGKIRVHVQTYPLSRSVEAYAELRSGNVRGRAVIIPD
jgi:propanol-preferring alcohol dehydrogenase